MLYKFSQCELDLRRYIFRRNGKAVSLEPQVFNLLALFLRHAGDLVDRDRMLAAVWDGRIVSEATISSRINAVRRAIGDDGKAQALLQTIPRCGFRFVAPVETLLDDKESHAPPERKGNQSIRMAQSRDGTSIAFAISGSGPPLLRAGHFLTHLEFDWDSPVWRPLLDRLGDSFTVIRYDQRCTGLSGGLTASLSLEALVDDLEAVADMSGLERFPIFAASQGVPVAVAFAVRHPERVSKLVLYGGYAQGRSVRGTREEAEHAEAILRIIRLGWGRKGGAFSAALSTLYMPDATKEQLQHMTEMQLASASAENAVALRMAVDAFDVSALLGKVEAPTLVLHASDDAVHPVAQSRILAAGIPNAQIHVSKGRNHVLLPEDPCWSQVLADMERFLQEA